MKGRYGLGQAFRLLSFRSGLLGLWVIEVLANAISSRACSSVVDRQKMSALKLRHQTAWPSLAQNWFFVQDDIIFEGEGGGKAFIADLKILSEVRGMVDFWEIS